MIWKDFSCKEDTVLFEKKYFKLVGKEILQARKIPWNELLNKEESQGNDSKLTLNVTHYPVFRHLKP